MIIIINKCLPASTPAPEQLPLACKILYVDIVDMERFTGLKIHGFNPTKVFWKYFYITLARSAYIYGKTFTILLKSWKP